MNKKILIDAIRHYETTYNEEASFVPQFLELLRHPLAFHRNHLPAHITGSAWIVDPSRKFVLLTHHAKLNKWLQPGGHADGDDNVLRVALREATEETGLTDLNVLQDVIFDIDIHSIPLRGDFPGHLHYDIRFLLEADRQKPLTVTSESKALRWVPVTQLADQTGGNESITRMAAKVRLLFGAD